MNMRPGMAISENFHKIQCICLLKHQENVLRPEIKIDRGLKKSTITVNDQIE